jgi:SOS-response transcriptional repressor LexA
MPTILAGMWVVVAKTAEAAEVEVVVAVATEAALTDQQQQAASSK